ncbi:hypothetical protein ACGFW5_15855 [Streptomyces sp. NPDC048416]|uniref:hypothetical protein n=1 Tax=Streptomyces sp. NPDC048416 TaxID=3365546 RepID=UPI00370F9789
MAAENVPVFRAAFTRLGAAPARLNWADGDVPSGLDPVEPHPSWRDLTGVPRALDPDAAPDGPSAG